MNNGQETRRHMMNRLWDASSIKHHRGKPLVCLALASAYWARLADGVADIILVGDSMNMTIYGQDDTHSVTLAMMARHGSAVVAATSQSMVVLDAPREVRDWNKEQKADAMKQLLQQTQAQGVKIEGGAGVAQDIAHVVSQGTAVMGHVGLMPQYASDHRVAGREHGERARILKDARAIAKAGVFAMVVECVPQTLAAEIASAVDVPVIGIGASPQCDGQILVAEDILALTPRQPHFVRVYDDSGTRIRKAFARYADDVRDGDFPKNNECYTDK